MKSLLLLKQFDDDLNKNKEEMCVWFIEMTLINTCILIYLECNLLYHARKYKYYNELFLSLEQFASVYGFYRFRQIYIDFIIVIIQ